jgi:Glutaredoxin-like domain (DUF836)
MKVLLLGTSGCHLCEQAEELINESLQTGLACSIEIVDIAEQTQWQHGFATQIPVLLHQESQHYLDWPFTQNDVLTFIKQHHD